MGPLRTPVGKLNCTVLRPAQRAHLKTSPACTSSDGRPHPESGGRAGRTSLPVTRSPHPGACFQQVSVSLFFCSLLLAAGTVALLASRGCVSQRSLFPESILRTPHLPDAPGSGCGIRDRERPGRQGCREGCLCCQWAPTIKSASVDFSREPMPFLLKQVFGGA